MALILFAPCTIVNESMSVPSGGVMSSDHHGLDVALKSSSTIVTDGGICLTKLRSFSKCDKNSSNSTAAWLGDR